MLLLSPSSPRATTEVVNGNKMLPHIDTSLGKGEETGAGGSGRNGAPAPIAIPIKSPDSLNESAISSLTLGGEGLVSGLPNTGVRPGFSNEGGAGDSDGEGDGEADFDGRTRRAGSTSPSGDSGSDSDGWWIS